VGRQELLERARAIAPTIAASALETERQRKPLDENIRLLDEAGLFTMLVPKRWGGPELDLTTQLEVVEIISAACMSTGWITAFYLGHHVFACRFSEQAQQEIFANGPRCLLPASTAAMMHVKSVPGGWELTGRAPWGSGIMHADWVLVGGIAEDGQRAFILPVEDVRCDDVWHMAGMAGTGSNDIVLESVFVPAHRSELQEAYMSGRTEGCHLHANPMYSMQLMPFIYSEIIGIFTGGLAGAQAAFADTVGKRIVTHSGQAAKERPQSHIQLGASASNVMAGKELARSIVRKTDEIIAAGESSLTERLELKALTGLTVDHCRRALNDMVNRAGSACFAEAAPLQRFFRDLNMIAIHAFWDYEVAYEQLGRHIVGLAPNNPLI